MAVQAKLHETSGMPICSTRVRRTPSISASRWGGDHVSHTCFGKGLCTLACQDILVTLVTCRAAADVEKVIVLNSVFAPRDCACMQTQHKIEMDKRDGKFGYRTMAVPPVQQMSRFDQAIPPAFGYPPPGAYPPPCYPR